MKLDSTRLVAQTLLPNTRPLRWNQTTSKISPAAPEARQTSQSQRVCRVAFLRLGSMGDPIGVTIGSDTGTRAWNTHSYRTSGALAEKPRRVDDGGYAVFGTNARKRNGFSTVIV